MKPGVYEVPFGIRLREVFEMCDAEDPMAAQVGGPSGQMVGEADFDRTICFDDLATGGSLMVFGRDRDVLEIATQQPGGDVLSLLDQVGEGDLLGILVVIVEPDLGALAMPGCVPIENIDKSTRCRRQIAHQAGSSVGERADGR